jgi:SAM-dependent methyltransferase
MVFKKSMKIDSSFRCCICGQVSPVPESNHRELSFCPSCGSNARFRGLIVGVLKHIFEDSSIPLKDQPPRPEVAAIGISDSDIYATILMTKLSYKNTFLHAEPFLDLCDVEAAARFSNLDLIICSDVIEHTKEPPIVVLRNMMSMLRPGGLLILSAPTYQMPTTIEWYAGAKDIQVVTHNHRHLVLWTTIRNVDYVDTNPSFHGGPGAVLEMRLISHSALMSDASKLGFATTTLEFDSGRGYDWPIVPQYPGVDAPMDGRILALRNPL